MNTLWDEDKKSWSLFSTELLPLLKTYQKMEEVNLHNRGSGLSAQDRQQDWEERSEFFPQGKKEAKLTYIAHFINVLYNAFELWLDGPGTSQHISEMPLDNSLGALKPLGGWKLNNCLQTCKLRWKKHLTKMISNKTQPRYKLYVRIAC